MDQVPKILKPMVDEWTPEGFVVSFKVSAVAGTPSQGPPLCKRVTLIFVTPACRHTGQLETDPTILIPKARVSLERYGHQVVIGNDLNRRKYEVVFVSKVSTTTGSPTVEEWLTLSTEEIEQGKEIESDIVTRLVRLHATYNNGGKA